MARYFISLTFTVRSSRSNNAACKARKELSVLNSLIKSMNVKFGFPTVNGHRFESEKEEREDGEGDEDRRAGMLFRNVQRFEMGQILVEEGKQAEKICRPVR